VSFAVAAAFAVAAVVARAGVALGTKLRATGRGFGDGTLGWDCPSVANADGPSSNVKSSVRSSARLTAKAVERAVDRNAEALAEEVTAFLRGESLDR